MSTHEASPLRFSFLFRVLAREAEHLRITDRRVFSRPFDPARALALADDVDDAERVEAFVARFARLQDTLGDKVLPALLAALGEPVAAVIDNLDRAERLGLLPSADEWLATRRLRNRMVQEYVEDPVVLAESLRQGHGLVPMLLDVERRFRDEALRRGWIDPQGSPSA